MSITQDFKEKKSGSGREEKNTLNRSKNYDFFSL